MKNKEKFAKEILDIVCTGDDVAIDKDTMKLRACNRFSKFECLKCLNCYFSEENFPLHTKNCIANFVHWANSEYKEKKVFSEADKALVKGLDKLNWFAKDKNGIVYGYVDKPFRNGAVWDVEVEVGDNYALARASSYTSATFEPLSWDDEEPTHRSEILEDEE